MHPNHPALVTIIANTRTAELRNEAAQERIARDAGTTHPRLGRIALLRRAVGTVLVRAGERLQGAQQPATRETQPSAFTGHLRVVR
jgi:hypothetical protein